MDHQLETDSIDSPWLPPKDDHRSRRKTVTWEGRQVTEKEGIALKHLFNDLQDYFGQPTGEPRVTFIIDRQDHGGDKNESDSDKNNSTSLSIWRGKLSFMYKIRYKNRETSQQLDYIGIDVCIDLTPKKELRFSGHDMKGYCKTWIYASAPRYTIETVLQSFEDGTGLEASKSGFVLDENRNMITFEAKLLAGEDSETTFTIPNEEDEHNNHDDDGNGDRGEFTRIGSVQEASQDLLYQRFIRCIGIFTMNAEVSGSSARLSLTLVSVRAQGVANNLAPIVYDPRHCTECSVDDNLVSWDY